MSSRTAHQQRNSQQRRKLNVASSYYSVERKSRRVTSEYTYSNMQASAAMAMAVMFPLLSRMRRTLHG